MLITTRQMGKSNTCFPIPKKLLNFFPARSVYTVGQPDGQHREWKPLPPFGRELITVIATKQPLVFTPKRPRYDPEPARSYSTSSVKLSRVSLAQAEIAATFYPIETRKTRP